MAEQTDRQDAPRVLTPVPAETVTPAVPPGPRADRAAVKSHESVYTVADLVPAAAAYGTIGPMVVGAFHFAQREQMTEDEFKAALKAFLSAEA